MESAVILWLQNVELRAKLARLEKLLQKPTNHDPMGVMAEAVLRLAER